MPPENYEPTAGARRTRLWRERRRLGVVCVARVPVYVRDVETLVAADRLQPADQRNRAKIGAAIEALVDDYTEGKLAVVK